MSEQEQRLSATAVANILSKEVAAIARPAFLERYCYNCEESALTCRCDKWDAGDDR